MFEFLRKRKQVPEGLSERGQALAAELARLQGQRAQLPRRGTRRFDAAVVDRLTASWVSTNAAIDQELRGQLDLLRNRSRDLFKNNEYAAKFGRMVENNVVGADGFTLQSRVLDPSGSPDAQANQAIEAAFYRWRRPGHCDVTGKHSFVRLCRSMLRSLARDGEFLVKKVRGRGEFGFQLQLLDVARLDTTFNRAASGNENAVIMGVEVDAAGAPVAYHLWSAPSASFSSRVRERIPADEIIHRFIPIEDEQTRGVPWLHAAMRRLNDLNGYREAAVIAARIGASKMGFFHSKDGQPPTETETDENGDFITQASPGEFGVLPEGYEFTAFDPTYPHDQFDAFCKATLRGVASGIGVAYNALANDLEGVNYSSIRAGVLDEREEWMGIQGWMIDTTLIPIFEEWLTMALTAGMIRLPNGSALPISKFEKFSQHMWLGRRWGWVDPQKDVDAAVTGINNRLTSPQRVAAQSGLDIEDVLDDIAAFEKLAAAKNVALPPLKSGSSSPAPPTPTDTTTAG